MNKQQVKIQTIYNRSLQTKAEIRAESEKEVKAFLRKGGVIEVSKPRKSPKSKMSAKSSKGYVSGTNGFAAGYPRRTIGA